MLENLESAQALNVADSGFRTLERSCRVEIISDSRCLIDALQKGWLTKWKRNGWKTKKKEPVLNQDLWNELDQLLSEHQPSYRWVKGGTDRMWKTTDANMAEEAAANAGKDQGFDYVYERLSGFNARTARPLSKPLIQCREDHEAMIASELVWSDSVSTDEYA